MCYERDKRERQIECFHVTRVAKFTGFPKILVGEVWIHCLFPPDSKNPPTRILGKPGNLLKVPGPLQPYM
jgi:hypothetical protein